MVISIVSFIASYFGAKIVSIINPATLKPIILSILIAIAVYTFLKKDLGKVATKQFALFRQMIFGAAIGLIIGFYDGFFDPVREVFSCWHSFLCLVLNLFRHQHMQKL